MNDVDDDIEGRAARLKAAFPGAYHQDGALVSFDMATIKERMGWRDAAETRSGVKFTWLNGEVWILLDTKVGNVQSSWSWRVTEDEWTAAIEAIAEAKAFAAMAAERRADPLSILRDPSRERTIRNG